MEGPLVRQSKTFAINVIKFYKYLNETKKEHILSKQLLRSSTSIGANVNEGQCTISKEEFISKYQIALKEARETLYWLDLLKETDYLTNDYLFLIDECNSLQRMLVSALKTAKENSKKDYKIK